MAACGSGICHRNSQQELFNEICQYGALFLGRDTHEMQSAKLRRSLLIESMSIVELRLLLACPSAISRHDGSLPAFCVMVPSSRRREGRIGTIWNHSVSKVHLWFRFSFARKGIYHAVHESILQYEGQNFSSFRLRVRYIPFSRTVNNAKHIAVTTKASEDLMCRKNIFTGISIKRIHDCRMVRREGSE